MPILSMTICNRKALILSRRPETPRNRSHATVIRQGAMRIHATKPNARLVEAQAYAWVKFFIRMSWSVRERLWAYCKRAQPEFRRAAATPVILTAGLLSAPAVKDDHANARHR